MVKYLTFHNSVFSLRYFECKWQGHSVTHPLLYFDDHEEIAKTKVLFVAHLVSLESLKCVGVYQGGFVVFRLTM